MTLAIALAPLAHLFGDYVLQPHTMAMRKTTSWRWAAVHAAFYALPFLALLVALAPAVRVPLALLVIGGTHAVIDRLGIAGMWCRWYGVGHPGIWWTDADRAAHLAAHEAARRWKEAQRVSREARTGVSHPVPKEEPEPSDFPYPPPFLGVWLTIIVDNTMHLLINTAALAWACS